MSNKMGGAQTPWGISEETWSRIPLAKRRLLVEGSLVAGTEGARLGALAIAGELERNDVPWVIAERLVVDMPITLGSTPEHRVRQQMREAVRWAYRKPGGSSVNSGCPGQQPPPRNALVDTFAAYCDAACQTTCAIRGAARGGNRIDSSPYRAVYRSGLWARGGAGLIGRDVYGFLVQRALPGVPIVASATGLAQRSGFIYGHRNISDLLRRFEEWGLVSTVGGRYEALRVVHVLTVDQVAVLEERLGLPRGAGRTARNVHDVWRDVPRRYQRVLRSSLWVPPPRGLGPLSRDVYALLAARSGAGRRPIECRVMDAVADLGNLHTEDSVRKAVARLIKAGVVQRKGRAHYRLADRSRDSIQRLEQTLGTAAAVESNRREALRVRDRLNDAVPRWADAEVLVAGTAWGEQRGEAA